MRLSDFDFELPDELIARDPLARRDGSRMLHLPRDGSALTDTTFAALPTYLRPGDLLILNDARVIRARLRGHKLATGGEVEVLLDRPVDPAAKAHLWYALGNASKGFRPGQTLDIAGTQVTVAAVDPESAVLTLDFGDRDPLALAEASGELPLPPYLDRAPKPEDEERYQTVYARQPGAVAAPTAGLHFTPEVFEDLQKRGVNVQFLTLLVGPGTFLPIRTEDLSAHKMMLERFEIGQSLAQAFDATRAAGGRVVAVGTTVVRALESAVDHAGRLALGPQATSLFIQPGHRFNAIDGLLTNFHLPKSSLYVLVSALAGLPRVRAAYAHAIAGRYRFFSYGDCSLFL